MDCIRYPKLIHLITESLYLLTNISTFPHSLGPDNHQSTCFYYFSDTIYKWYHNICLSLYSVQFSSVWLLSRVRLIVTPWIAAHQASLSITNSQSPTKPMSIESVMPSSHLILCRPLLLLPPIPPSIRVFSNESTLRMKWPKYCSFSLSISPSNEHPGLISFRMDSLDFLAGQGTVKSLLQHHSSKASILQCSAFFTVQLSHPYMTTGKIIALTWWTFVGQVMSLFLNMLSRLVITFPPRSKCLFISWLQSPSHNVLTVHPFCHKWQDLHPSHAWITLHCLYLPHLLYPFICKQTFPLFLSYCK